MESTVFSRHECLKGFPPAQLFYIVYRRLREHGLRTTWLWINDKIVRRTRGFSVPSVSRVAPHLYVGGQHRRRGLAAMRGLGITAVVNMREEADDDARGVKLDAYLWLPTPDDAAPTADDLARGVAFIEEQLGDQHGVYIHCASGVGRAPTMAAAYFVHRGATPGAAWEIIRRGRPFIRPTPPQIAAIVAFAKHMSSPSGDVADDPGSAGALQPAPARLSQGGPSGSFRPPSSMEERETVAYSRISEDAALTGDLTDDAAKFLLKRAREEVHRLVAATAGLEERQAWDYLDPRLHHLRQYLRSGASLGSSAADPNETLRTYLDALTYPDQHQ